ncbi:MAG: hypothetical protein HY658_10395 [Actinobacteria bacterium]|nr:hypothetical protein [Actinomycetota bacterium]
MGEKVILVCDVCGQPASETANIKVGRRSLVKDLCDRHIAELTSGARRARPGRRRAVAAPSAASAPKRRPGRPRKSTAAAAKPANG